MCEKEDLKRNPWSFLVPTITGHSSILMRWQPEAIDEQPPLLRLLTGQELMRVMGWSQSMWAADTEQEMLKDTELLTSLSGNAFSGFACGPVLILGLALAGCTPSMFPAPRSSAAGAEDDGASSNPEEEEGFAESDEGSS